MVRVRVGTLSEFADGWLPSLDAGGTRVIVGQVGEALYAARNRCPQLGFSLTTGPGDVRFSGGEVQCPGHNSRCDLCTGENRDWAPGRRRGSRAGTRHGGRTGSSHWAERPAPLTTYRVDVEGEDVFVHL